MRSHFILRMGTIVMAQSKPKVTVLTVTKRGGWSKVAIECLERQTFKDFNWVIVYEPGEILYEDTKRLSRSKLDITLVQAPIPKRVSNLSASDNEGLRACTGKYVMFYQDFIILEDDCMEKLVKLAKPDLFLTTLTRNVEGDEEDPRYTWQDEVRECHAVEWEENVSMAPLKAFKELGGYDEEYDNGWAWNNCNVAERADMLGYRFLLDETNRPQLIFHVKEPVLNPNMPENGDLHDKTMNAIRAGKKPLKLNYL